MMDKTEKGQKMLIPTVITGVIALGLLLIAYQRGQHLTGLDHSLQMLLQILPLLIFAFIIAGMIQVLLPHEAISRWIGEESGLKGLIMATIAGALTPGGPYTSMPIAAGLMRAGASIGIMVAYMTGWSLWAVSRLPLEIGLLGWRFALVRILSVLIMPPIAGLFAQYIARLIR